MLLPCQPARSLWLLFKGCLAASCAGSGAATRAGTKWTARQRTLGWRHFHAVSQRREGETGERYVLLVSTCDANAKLWINAANLKSREAWAPGWLQRRELETLEGPACPACKAAGSVPCDLCTQAGQEIEL